MSKIKMDFSNDEYIAKNINNNNYGHKTTVETYSGNNNKYYYCISLPL